MEATTQPGEGGGRRRPAAEADAGRRPHGPHAVAHLPARRPLRRRRRPPTRPAILADEDYITQCRAQGLYPMAYYPHNIHFLWFAATTDGRGQVAIDVGAQDRVEGERRACSSSCRCWAASGWCPYYALTRFGRWDEMLAEPAPAAKFLYLKGIWHYARGLAFVGKGQLDDAERELAEVRAHRRRPRPQLRAVLAEHRGRDLRDRPRGARRRAGRRRKEYDKAVAHLERAVRLEDGLVYTEPSEWHYPPRHALGRGAAGTRAGATEAEAVYWEDLRRSTRERLGAPRSHPGAARPGKADEEAATSRRASRRPGRAPT